MTTMATTTTSDRRDNMDSGGAGGGGDSSGICAVPTPMLVAVVALAAVFAAATFAVVVVTSPAITTTPEHLGLIDAMAMCHTGMDGGCGRASMSGDEGTPHILVPPTVIATYNTPTTVSISGLLPPDSVPPARVWVSVHGPVGHRGASTTEQEVVSTPSGRYSIHPTVLPPTPGTHEYVVNASYILRDLNTMVDAGTATFTILVLEPKVSRSSAPDRPYMGEQSSSSGGGGGLAGDGTGAADGMGTNAGHPPPPPPVIDGIVAFEAPPVSVSTGQTVVVRFTYSDGAARESTAYVRGPAPTMARLTEPAYAGTGEAGTPGTHSFLVQPTWAPGTYGVVVLYGGVGGRPGTTAGILPVNVVAGGSGSAGGSTNTQPFSCVIHLGGGIDAGGDSDGDGDGGTGAGTVRHGRSGGCFAGIITAVQGPDMLTIDGRPVALSVSNARHPDDAAAESAAVERLRALCPSGSTALVDKDDTLVLDSREPNPTIRGGYYSHVWCLGKDGAAYNGTIQRHRETVNRMMMLEGHASADAAACLSSERRLEWPECDAYTAVEQAVGGAVSAAIDAVASSVSSGDGGDDAGGGGSDADGDNNNNNILGLPAAGDCPVALAVYGTPAAAAAQALREHRDALLYDDGGRETAAGTLARPALHAYYAVAPYVADIMRDAPHMREAAAAALVVPLQFTAAAVDATADVVAVAVASTPMDHVEPPPPEAT